MGFSASRRARPAGWGAARRERTGAGGPHVSFLLRAGAQLRPFRMAATDREPLTLDASAEEAASAPAGLAGVRLALAAGEEVRRFAGELGRAVPPAARVSEPLLAPLAATLWSLRAGHERRGLALLVADDDAARELA